MDLDLIGGIQQKFRDNEFEFSKHAVDRMILRHITVSEVRQAVLTGEVIEDYPDERHDPKVRID